MAMGLGMFAIMVPALLIPAIWTLYGMQRKAEELGMVSTGDSADARKGGEKIRGISSYARIAWMGLIEIDLARLVLLGLAFSLILLPFNLANSAKGGWSNPSMISMLVVGFAVLGLFVVFEAFLAPKPIMTKRILQNKAFLAAGVVDVFRPVQRGTTISRHTCISSRTGLTILGLFSAAPPRWLYVSSAPSVACFTLGPTVTRRWW